MSSDRQARRLRRRWETLPDALQTPQQVAGVRGVSCGATYGLMERCNFACTSCYLSDLANATDPAPFSEARRQLRALREHLGPGGKVQITSGEVTLLPVEQLGRVVAHARSIGLDPMVMTNGQVMLDDPGYLETLVREHGLEKVSFHVDSTQLGRPGMPLGLEETEVHPVRDRCADLLRRVRHRTGRRLHAAHTATVTADNLEGVADVVRWGLDNLDAFRLLSFLPVAEVGRTRDRRGGDLTLEGVWARIERGFGRSLNRDAMYFGHPRCNVVVPLLVVDDGDRREVVEVVREDRRWDLRVFGWAMREFGHLADVDGKLDANLRSLLLPLLRRPHRLLELLAYGLHRGWGERRWLARLGLQPGRWTRLRIRPLLIVIHRFMRADELDTPLGRERLEACVFRVPVDGRMVSMCEVNATSLRRRLDQRAIPAESPLATASEGRDAIRGSVRGQEDGTRDGGRGTRQAADGSP